MTQSIPLLYNQKAHSAEELLEFYRLTQQQLRNLHGLSSRAMPMIEDVLDHFYAWMRNLPDFMAFFQSESALQHVRAMQSLYWKQFLQAEVNEAYLGDRRKIGEIHARIGLPVMFYMAGVSMVYDELAQVNQRLHQDGQVDAGTLQTMASLLHMDAGLICQAFVDKRDELLNEQSQAVLSMSTPVTEIWDGILLLPVVGIVDSKRSEDIMNAVLTSIRTAKAKEFILDISGVGVVDTAVANYLISISKATGLMGCRTTISGISPAISKTIIQLGIDIGDVNTTATMMDALAIAFENRGLKLKQKSGGKRSQ
ncbi:MAG: protoglobin domain-containing protein [Vulcanococcus sp.]